MAEFLPWLFLAIAILICAAIVDALATPEPVERDPAPEPSADRWVRPDAEMLRAWVTADGELASRLRVPPWVNPSRDGTAWLVRDHQQRRAVELVNARRGGERRLTDKAVAYLSSGACRCGADGDNPCICLSYASDPTGTFPGPVVRTRCRRCRLELAECQGHRGEAS